MKKTTILNIVALMGTVCISASGTNYKSKSVNTNPPGEDVIDLYYDAVYPENTTNYTNYATTDILISGISVASTTFTLTQAALDTLQNRANELGSGFSGGYITALQFKYGINSSNTMSLYVRGVYLTHYSTSNSPVYTYTATPQSSSTSTNPYFSFVSSGIGIAVDYSNQNVTDSVRYTNQSSGITIKHYPGDPNPYFNPGNDVSSVIYPLQEVDTLLHANNCRSLTIINAGYPVPENVSSNSYPIIRHTLLLEPSQYNGTFHARAFPINACADLAGMCPPECPNSPPGIQYTILTAE